MRPLKSAFALISRAPPDVVFPVVGFVDVGETPERLERSNSSPVTLGDRDLPQEKGIS